MNKKNDKAAYAFRYYLYLFLSFLLTTACSDKSDPEKNIPALNASLETDGQQWAALKLPDTSRQPIRLSVASVVNPRFKQLSDLQLKKILQQSQRLVKQHFNIDVAFSEIKKLTIDQVFDHLDADVMNVRQHEIVNLDFIDDGSRDRMQQSIYKVLSNYSDNEQNVIDFAQPYLLRPEVQQKNFTDLSFALVDTLISRLLYWKKRPAADGLPILSSDNFHEWVWWDSLGYSDLTYDVMITNQLVASAEYYAMDVHSSIRGGLTAGTTTYNKNTSFNAYVYIMAYPMLNDTELLTMLRDDKSYSEQQIINYTAALLTHELGHMLLHLGHPFGNKYCVMTPTVMLNYRQWYDGLDAEKCAIGSSAQMTPGVAKIEYNSAW